MNDNNEQAEVERINQNNINLENSQETFFNRISSKDVLSITSDFIPSTIIIFFIIYALATTEKFCDKGFIGILRALAFIYSAFIIKSILHTILIVVNSQNSNFSKISMTTMNFIISTAYYSAVVFAYFIYKQRPDECFMTNTFATMLIFCLVFLGVVNICRHILNIFMIILCFPIMVFYFLRNPQSFYSNFGIDPEIVKNLPTHKADATHAGKTCIICMADLVEGDDILILRCPGRHFFHANCIKDWLVRKVACPVCRDENVL